MQEIQAPYKRHIFVCLNERTENQQSCGPDGGHEILKQLREYINKNGLVHKYNVSKVKCLGHCLEGPTIAIYPEGKIFTEVKQEDIKEIIKDYLS